ncbi:MAG: putative toxin-antitoxin system toxin component, PIN family [Myxococcota bacterium]
MVRAVLDTNVLISALIRPDGPPGRILEALIGKAFEMVISPGIVGELRRAARYRRVRKHIRISEAQLEVRLAQIEAIGDPVAGNLTPQVAVRDPEDIMLLATAVEGRADYLVTGDEDLLTLARHQGIAIVTPRVFLGVLKPSRTSG